MSADITGAEKIQEYIRKSGRDSFSIRRPGQSLNQTAIFEYEGSSPEDASQQFGQWADLCGDYNTQHYELNLYKAGVDYDNQTSEQKKKRKYQSKLVLTFQLNDYSHKPVQEGQQPTQQVGTPIYKERDLSGYVSKADVEELINRAVEKVQTNHEIQNMAAKIAMLSRQLEEYDMEEEEEDDEEEDYPEEKELTEAEMIQKVGETIEKVVKTGKDAYMEIKGVNNAGKVTGAVEHKLHAAGPSEQDFYIDNGAEPEVTTEEAPEEAKPLNDELQKSYEAMAPGTVPPFIKAPIHADQQAKINKALQFLYTKDQHLGDDLVLIMKMAQLKPKKFEGLIISLRED